VKAFFDTSVLVAVFFEDHEHHAPSLEAFLKLRDKQGFCAAHTLAEFYATVTRLPGRHRLSGEQVLLFLGEIRERLAIVALTAQEYFSALQDAARLGIAGGAVYDLLLADCARKTKADVLFTWNVRHFQRFGPDIAALVKAP
jgi:predicted nucleic acid-binding protein